MLDRMDKSLAPGARIDEPAGALDSKIGWGSDVAAQMLRRLERGGLEKAPAQHH